MSDQARARTRRLWAWFALNLVIFVACYLNYRLQLKHRYLYRTLGVGLCLSRAAAMVINFNLLLVWLPMCKYTLTRLAVLANHSAGRNKSRLGQLMAAASSTSDKPPERVPAASDDLSAKPNPPSLASRVGGKFKQSFGDVVWRLRCALCSLKIKFTGNFLVAVDHCTSLHTICATTITIASVIHTVAHLMNVINFSNKFDSLLGDLNMAEYRGQNPLQLIVSVPGITGCCMVLILFLMSLSSISMIRNSSYDLFQIFHRLSVLFVVLLILHPSSHVLKEQSNVGRHHPEICYDKMQQWLGEQPDLSAATNDSLQARSAVHKGAESSPGNQTAGTEAMLRTLKSTGSGLFVESSEWTRENITLSPTISAISTNKSLQDSAPTQPSFNDKISPSDLNGRSKREIQDREDLATEAADVESESANENSISLDELCIDLRPLFVAQSSICWYVLGAGLSCYLLDLFLRRLRRSRSPIGLLDARADAEGNLIELVLSNNHKRFVHWLPGQFVYLNCPQIATYEWHPFTISSMDSDKRQFTLHIKAGGDWTRKLRYELELRQTCQKLQQQASEGYAVNKEKSMSLFCQRQLDANGLKTIPGFGPVFGFQKNSSPTTQWPSRPDFSKIVNVVANVEDFDHTTGQLQVECKRWVRLAHQDNGQAGSLAQKGESTAYANGSLKIDLNHVQLGQQLYTIVPPEKVENASSLLNRNRAGIPSLTLFIDGPFHSPFERLLGQQVSVCIASGVGWTAFSSIFQQITDNMIKSDVSNNTWWWRWRNFRPVARNRILNSDQSLVVRANPTQTRLHLVVIVTTMEQFKPFYNIVKRYFESSRRLGINAQNQAVLRDPVQEVTAFITRSAICDSDVVDFCRKENLSLANEQKEDSKFNHCADTLKINEAFLVQFGRPDFNLYLSKFSNLYADRRKISVYCCGPHQVKRTVKEICKNLNKSRHKDRLLPNFRYHEENF